MTSNDQRRWHWRRVAAAKAAMGLQVFTAIPHERVPGRQMRQAPAISGPVVVDVDWQVTDNRRRDVDSLGPFTKAALDALVRAGVFPDDHSGVIRAVQQRITRSETARIVVTVRAIEKGEN